MNNPAPRRDTLYYDGRCGLCVRSMRIIRRLDWLGRLNYTDSTTLTDHLLPVSRDDSLVGVPMKTRDGEILIGFPAVRRALLQTPLGAAPALALYLPIVSFLGRRLYNYIAARRWRACAVTAAASAQRSR